MPLTLIHVTAAYSNAVLTAIMPHVSDCAKQLNLPIEQPVVVSQVARFNANPIKGEIGGGLWLTNGYWFAFSSGCVDSFRCPNNWFTNEEIENLKRFSGKSNITTNDAIVLARSSLKKLGFNPESCHTIANPTSIEGPFEIKNVGHVPYCRVVWKEVDSYTVQFDVDMQRKQIVGMFLVGTNFVRPDPKIDVIPMSESDYRRKNATKMFYRTNDIRSLRKAVKEKSTNSAEKE